MMDYDNLTKKILFSMHRKGYYGSKHTPVVHICKILPLPNYSCKEIKRRIKELIRNGLIISYPITHGLDVYININKSKDVKKIIKPLEEDMGYF